MIETGIEKRGWNEEKRVGNRETGNGDKNRRKERGSNGMRIGRNGIRREKKEMGIETG